MSDWSDLLDQLKADTSSKEERDKALAEKDKLMSDMEYQGRSQHQLAKEFPNYSQLYGNRSIYSPNQNLSGFAEQPDIKSAIDSLQKNQSLQNLNDQSFALRDKGQTLAAEALAKDKYKTTNPVDFINDLKNTDKLNYNIATSPDLIKEKKWNGVYTNDPSETSKKAIIVDKSKQGDLGTWLHEHLHAKNTASGDTGSEKLNMLLSNDKFRQDELNRAIEDKDVNTLRQMLSGGHFNATPNALPETYVQDQFENTMKDRGFETRKDPIKSRFERLKQLMRY